MFGLVGFLCRRFHIRCILLEILNMFMMVRIFITLMIWQMFTNGMSESMSTEVCLKDVSVEAFKIMLEYIYSGEFDKGNIMDIGILLLQLLLLADQFGVSALHQECCKMLLECLSEVV